MTISTFTAACFEALYFTDTGADDEIPTGAEMSDETRLDLEADCRSFYRRYSHYFVPGGQDDKQAGHDFWLTRNGHGAGFWDGDWNEPYGEMLTAGSKQYGEFQPYLGDDGLIYA
ncbi:hypothetical protein LCGC14_0653880 [marine sediment metagenome]|uniref:Uncharacterized protein n=1 Tax=marine sediment metagenome TaxID=412755 RepID=A0A0F9U402_9ZZZZ